MPEPKHSWSSAHVTNQSGTPTEEYGSAVYPDHSLPLEDEVNGMPDMPDTIPWCPEDDVASIVPMYGAGMDSVIPKAHRLPTVAYRNTTLFAADGTNSSVTLDHPANSVAVDNYAGEWLRVNQDIWVPPMSIGWVFVLPSSTKNAAVQWEAPGGSTQTTKLSGSVARVQWFEEQLKPATGVALYPAGGPSGALNTSQVAVTTGSTILAANGARRTVTIFNTAAAGGNVVYVGGTSAVSTTTGGAIPPQTAFTLSNYSGALFGSATGGSSTTVTVTEESA